MKLPVFQRLLYLIAHLGFPDEPLLQGLIIKSDPLFGFSVNGICGQPRPVAEEFHGNGTVFCGADADFSMYPHGERIGLKITADFFMQGSFQLMVCLHQRPLGVDELVVHLLNAGIFVRVRHLQVILGPVQIFYIKIGKPGEALLVRHANEKDQMIPGERAENGTERFRPAFQLPQRNALHLIFQGIGKRQQLRVFQQFRQTGTL